MKFNVQAIVKALVGLLVFISAVGCSFYSHADNDVDRRVYSINVHASNAADALNALAFQTGAVMLFPYREAKTRQANSVVGDYTIQEAITLMLKDSGLIGSLTSDGAIKISDSRTQHLKKSDGGQVMNSKKKLLASTVAFFVGGGVGVVGAQESASAEESGWLLEEVVVTAQKRETSLQDTAMAISVLSAETIDVRGLVSMDDYLRGLPGVSMQDMGAGQSSIVVRGLAGDPQTQAGLAGVYFGETPLSGFASSSIANNSGNVEVKLVDIAQIEMLRGPQGTLYGSDSMTGTLRVMPVAPNLNEIEGKLATRFSQTGEEGGNNTMLQGVLNIPLVEDTLAVRAVAYRFDNSGYVDNVIVSQPVSGLAATQAFGGVAEDRDDVGGDQYTGFRLAALWRPTEELDITLSYLQQDIEQDGIHEVGLNLAGDYQQRRFNTRVNGTSYPLLENEVDITSLVVNYDLGWGKVTSASSWVDYTSRIEMDFTFLSALFGLDNQPYGSRNSRTTEAFTEEVRLVSDLDGPFQFVAGLFYSDKEYEDDWRHAWTGAADQDPGVALQTNSGGEVDVQKSAFGEVSYAITDQLTATLGTRHYEYERDTDSLYVRGPLPHFGLDASPSPVVSEFKETGQLYKANLSYTASEDILLYAQWAEGFRPGSKITGENLKCNAIGITAPDTIDSDRTENMELGFKSSFADSRITLNAALYRVDWEDIPVVVNYGSGCSVTENAGKAKSEGIEVEIQAQLVENLRTDLSLSYGEATLVGDSSIGNDGDNLPGSSDFNASLGLQYDFNLFERNSFARLDYTYVSEYYSSVDASGNDFTPTPAGGFGQFNLKAGIEFNDILLDVFVNNLTNDDGLTWVENVTVTVGDDNTAYRIRPRTVGVSLAYQF